MTVHTSGPALLRRSLAARRISSGLAGLSAVLAAGAGAEAATSLPSDGHASLMVYTWQVVGFFTFAAIFALLALRPRTSPALWIVVIANKVVLSAAALAFGPAVAGSVQSATWDGALVVILTAGFAASLLARDRTGVDGEETPAAAMAGTKKSRSQ